MIIDVTAEDIRNGQRYHRELCAVALAVKRATGVRWASVGINIQTPGTFTPTPAIARRFWRRFDWLPHWFVRPFSFELELQPWEPWSRP